MSINTFLNLWGQSALTTLGLFWMAFWAFAFGYLISSMIQVFVTRQRMQEAMGTTGVKSVALATFFGFISSSCSFAALSTTRALFVKGAGLIPSLAFLLASTNLVIELGFIIAIFLSWPFVVGEYLGGLLLIIIMWIITKVSLSTTFERQLREHARSLKNTDEKKAPKRWKTLILSYQGWYQVANQYLSEWKMVWKDVTIGFTVAGIIATFVPKAFFASLFWGSTTGTPSFWQLLEQTLVGPIAAFFTFIGSMGNIPLAAVLFGHGVSFAGIMAFIFSDLVVLPVLRIQAKYYGLKGALYILGVFLIALVITALILHYGFSMLNLLPNASASPSMIERTFFKVDYTLFLNILFLLLNLGFIGWVLKKDNVSLTRPKQWNEIVLFLIAVLAFFWLIGGILVALFI